MRLGLANREQKQAQIRPDDPQSILLKGRGKSARCYCGSRLYGNTGKDVQNLYKWQLYSRGCPVRILGINELHLVPQAAGLDRKRWLLMRPAYPESRLLRNSISTLTARHGPAYTARCAGPVEPLSTPVFSNPGALHITLFCAM